MPGHIAPAIADAGNDVRDSVLRKRECAVSFRLFPAAFCLLDKNFNVS
jgi:hypothetical protein